MPSKLVKLGSIAFFSKLQNLVSLWGMWILAQHSCHTDVSASGHVPYFNKCQNFDRIEILWMQGRSWIWLGIFGSLMFIIGRLVDWWTWWRSSRCSKWTGFGSRSCEEEHTSGWSEQREGHMPLLLEDPEWHRRRKPTEEAAASSRAAYTLQGCPCWAGLI